MPAINYRIMAAADIAAMADKYARKRVEAAMPCKKGDWREGQFGEDCVNRAQRDAYYKVEYAKEYTRIEAEVARAKEAYAASRGPALSFNAAQWAKDTSRENAKHGAATTTYTPKFSGGGKAIVDAGKAVVANLGPPTIEMGPATSYPGRHQLTLKGRLTGARITANGTVLAVPTDLHAFKAAIALDPLVDAIVERTFSVAVPDTGVVNFRAERGEGVATWTLQVVQPPIDAPPGDEGITYASAFGLGTIAIVGGVGFVAWKLFFDKKGRR